MAAMMGFVATGSYRGIKDTATPLKAAMGAAATNLVLTPLLILGRLTRGGVICCSVELAEVFSILSSAACWICRLPGSRRMRVPVPGTFAVV